MSLSRSARAAAVTAGLLVSTTTACLTEPVKLVSLTLEASRARVVTGDTVILTAMATNPTSSTITAGYGCSPGIGFRVVGPDRVDRSLYDGVGFPCEVKPSNRIAPGETAAVVFAWRTPNVAGSYAVRAELLASHGPQSGSISITVSAAVRR